jgi:hypothetical protein
MPENKRVYELPPFRKRRFRANRGGHAPGHIREVFLCCFETMDDGEPWYESLNDPGVIWFRNPKSQARWNRMSARERGLWLTGQLWNCTDTLPGLACSDSRIDIPQGCTYATASRKLRAEMASETPVPPAQQHTAENQNPAVCDPHWPQFLTRLPLEETLATFRAQGAATAQRIAQSVAEAERHERQKAEAFRANVSATLKFFGLGEV